MESCNQIQVKSEEIEKTDFNTDYGQFEFLVMPTGLCNTPRTFQALMNSVLYDFMDENLVVYPGDLLSYSENWIDDILPVYHRSNFHKLGAVHLAFVHGRVVPRVAGRLGTPTLIV